MIKTYERYKNFIRSTDAITNIETSEDAVALTFDDGPHPINTPRLLSILEKHQVKATFFMLGECANKYPSVVKMVADAKHVIGNHSWDHPSFPMINSNMRKSQLLATENALYPFGLKLFRPPFGHLNLMSSIDAIQLGYELVKWNVAGFDWKDYDKEKILESVQCKIKPGSIILFHDNIYVSENSDYACRDVAFEAIDLFLFENTKKYKFYTIPELIKSGLSYRKKSIFNKQDQNFLKKLSKIDLHEKEKL